MVAVGQSVKMLGEIVMGTAKTYLLHGLCVAALLGSAFACTDYSGYCEEAIDCEDGNEVDVEACVVDMEEREAEAALWDCDEYFDALYECRVDNSKCKDEKYESKDSDGKEKCQDELDDLSACTW